MLYGGPWIPSSGQPIRPPLGAHLPKPSRSAHHHHPAILHLALQHMQHVHPHHRACAQRPPAPLACPRCSLNTFNLRTWPPLDLRPRHAACAGVRRMSPCSCGSWGHGDHARPSQQLSVLSCCKALWRYGIGGFYLLLL